MLFLVNMDNLSQEYQVVKNDEEQYSIWPVELKIPSGWFNTGYSGKKIDCLNHIEEVWTDMRPLSLRLHIEKIKNAPQKSEILKVNSESLIDVFLKIESHSISIPAHLLTTTDFISQFSTGYCYIEFPEIPGKPHLILSLNKDYKSNDSSITFAGDLVLDLVPIRCECQIVLNELKGKCKVSKNDNIRINTFSTTRT